MKRVKLGDICRFEYGKSLPENARIPGKFPVYGSNGPVGSHTAKFTHGKTIVIGRKGSIGEVHVSSDACWPIDTTYFIDETCSYCDLDWLAYVLKNLNLAELNKASGVPGLNRDDAYQQEIWLPETKDEQRQIAARLKAQLAEVDTALQAAQAQLRDADLLRQRLLQHAFDALADAPHVPLRDVADIVAGITLGRKTNETQLTQVPYMRVANVKDGVLDLSDMKTVWATQREIEKWTLRDGDLLLTEGGDPDKLGRGACWRNQLPLCIHQNHIFRVRLPGERYDPDFVSFQVGSPYGKAYFFAHAKKTTGIATINQGVLGAFPLLSPPLAHQRRVVALLKRQLAEVDTLRDALERQLRDLEVLPQRILTQAFGGPGWNGS